MSDAVPDRATIEALFWEVADFTVRGYTIAGWLGSFLCGVCVMMCFGYLRSGAEDSVYVKLSAIFATLLQVACATLEIVGNDQQIGLVLKRQIAPQILLPKSGPWIILVTFLSGMTAQGFYGRLIYRILLMSRSGRRWRWIWIVVFTALWLVVAAFGTGTVYEYYLIPTVGFSTASDQFVDSCGGGGQVYWVPELAAINLRGAPNVFYTGWLASTALLDLILSVILVNSFLSEIDKDTFAETKKLLKSLAVSTLETFSLTTLLAITDLGLASVFGHASPMVSARIDLVCYFVTIFIARSYCISFLFTLQRRAKIRKARARSRSGGSSSGANRGVFSKGTDRRANFGAHPSAGDRLAKDGTVIALGDMTGSFGGGPPSAGVVVETYKESRSEGAEGKDSAGPRILSPYGLDP